MKRKAFRISNKKILLIPILIVSNLLAIVLAYVVVQHYMQPYDIRFANGKIDVKNKMDIKEELQKQTDESMMNIQCNVAPTFTQGGKQGDLFIANSYENKSDIKLTITLKDSGQVLVETAIVKPGMTLHSVSLQKTLPAGEYQAVAKIGFYEADGTLDTSNQVDMLLHVKG